MSGDFGRQSDPVETRDIPVSYPTDPQTQLSHDIVRLTAEVSRLADLMQRMVDNDERMTFLTEALMGGAPAEPASIDVEQLNWFHDGAAGFRIREADGQSRPASPEEDRAIRLRYPKAANPFSRTARIR